MEFMEEIDILFNKTPFSPLPPPLLPFIFLLQFVRSIISNYKKMVVQLLLTVLPNLDVGP